MDAFRLTLMLILELTTLGLASTNDNLKCYCEGPSCQGDVNDDCGHCDGSEDNVCVVTWKNSCSCSDLDNGELCVTDRVNITYRCGCRSGVESENCKNSFDDYRRCCDKNFCNINLTIPNASTTFIPFPSSNFIVTSVKVTESPRMNQLDIIIPCIIVPVLLITVISGVVAVIIMLLIYKRKKQKKSRDNSNRNGCYDKKGPDGLTVDGSSYGFMQIIDPTPISITDMTLTCTSGSGGGHPHLVKRTIAKGTVLDENMVGGGRFGQVYLGYYQGEKYAVKKFYSRDEQSWFREKEIYKKCNMRHDNILTYVAADITSNNGVTELWLITQFHPRGSLFDELHRDPLTIEQTFKYIYSVCRGISYLHMEFPGTQGKPAIAHRDLKSKNLLVKNDDTLCIADFGLAIVMTDSDLRQPDNLRQGTKRYMAPELLEELVNPDNFTSFIKTDIYSFGMVMWEICRRCTSGEDTAEGYELPFEYKVPADPSFDDMREAVVLKGLTPDIPERWTADEFLRHLVKIMKECWLKDPAARPTSFHVKKMLNKILDNCNLKITMDF